jgi:type II secretory pathway component PulC
MADKGPSPEEQLLNLIEKGDSAKSSKAARRKKSFFSLSSGLGKSLTLGKWAGRIKFKKIESDVVNKVLIVLCVLMIAYSVIDFMHSRKDISDLHKEASKTEYIETKKPDISKLRPFLHYLALIQRRNIFSPIGAMKIIDEVKERRESLQNLLKDLVLVGISWGEEPQAMIENKNLNQTYFLREGEVINNLKIESILENKVIMSYEGEKGELM